MHFCFIKIKTESQEASFLASLKAQEKESQQEREMKSDMEFNAVYEACEHKTLYK